MLNHVAVLGVVLAAALPSAAFGQSPPQTPRDGPHRLLVSSGKVTAQAEGGWGCWFVSRPGGYGSGVCVDPPARPVGWVPSSRAPRPIDGELMIEAGARVDHMDARTGSTSLVPRALDGGGRRFAVTLTPGPAPVLTVTIRYSGYARADGSVESGTLTFKIGIREPEKEPVPGAGERVAPTAVTARSSARCKAGPRRQRCRFIQSGRVLRPGGRGADCVGGHVRISAQARGKTLFRARAKTSPDCRYTVRVRFRPSRDLTALKVSTRFLGTPSLGSKSAKPRTVRIRSL